MASQKRPRSCRQNVNSVNKTKNIQQTFFFFCYDIHPRFLMYFCQILSPLLSKDAYISPRWLKPDFCLYDAVRLGRLHVSLA